MNEVVIKSYTPQAIKGVGKGTYRGMVEVGEKVVSQAKSNASFGRYQTGNLKNSIMWKSGEGEKGGLDNGMPELREKVSKGELIVGSALLHSIYVEYGTRKMEAQPYLRNAIATVTNGVEAGNALKDAMYDSVRSFLRREGVL